MKMPERIFVGQQFWYPVRPESPFFKEYIRADIVPRWIPVEERLPKEGQIVWLAGEKFPGNFPQPVAWHKDSWIKRNGEPGLGLACWMSVPPLPGEGS